MSWFPVPSPVPIRPSAPVPPSPIKRPASVLAPFLPEPTWGKPHPSLRESYYRQLAGTLSRIPATELHALMGVISLSSSLEKPPTLDQLLALIVHGAKPYLKGPLGEFTTTYKPPAPRLVGIEPNPGPNHLGQPNAVQKTLSKLGVELGKRAAEPKENKNQKNKNKNQNRKPASRRPSTAARVAKAFSTTKQTTSSPAPVSQIDVVRSNTKTSTLRIPFRNASESIYITSNPNATPYLSTVGSTQGGLSYLDLHPIVNQSANQNAMFGTSIATAARAFTYYRIRNLTFRFRSCVPTSTSGELSIGYTSDPANPVIPTWKSVQSMQHNVSGPLYAGADTMTLRIPDMNKWCYTDQSSNSSDSGSFSAQRLDYWGELALASFGTTYTASTTVGVLEISGIIEFRELSNLVQQSPDPETGNPTQSLTLVQHTLDAEAGSPFGVAADFDDKSSYTITTNSFFDLSLFDGNTLAVPTPGIWRLRAQWFNVVGDPTAGAVLSTTTGTLVSQTASSAVPYSYQAIVAFVEAGTLSFDGPNPMDSGSVSFSLERLS